MKECTVENVQLFHFLSRVSREIFEMQQQKCVAMVLGLSTASPLSHIKNVRFKDNEDSTNMYVFVNHLPTLPRHFQLPWHQDAQQHTVCLGTSPRALSDAQCPQLSHTQSRG